MASVEVTMGSAKPTVWSAAHSEPPMKSVSLPPTPLTTADPNGQTFGNGFFEDSEFGPVVSSVRSVLGGGSQ